MLKKIKHKKSWFIISAILGLQLFSPSNGFAQDVKIDMEVSSKKVTLDSYIQLTITVHNAKNIEPIQLPSIDGFDIQYSGTSDRSTFVNGDYTSSRSFNYLLYPLKLGNFKIPSSQVTIAGKVFTLPIIPLEVIGSMNQVTPTSQSQPTSFQDKLFLVLKVPKKEIYLNEPLPIKVLLFVSGLSAQDIQYPELNNIGFTLGEYERPSQYEQIVSGLRYDIVEFNTKIYPTRVGELQLGPAKIECNVLVKSQGSSRFGRGGSIFDDDFFNSFFDSHQKRPIALESEQETINVLALPEENRPKNFSGAVGQFDLNVSVSPVSVHEGDPITLRTTILGKGNLATIQMPTIPIDSDFKLYDPQIFEKDNIKKGEQVIIPQSEDITEVPAIHFSFFDPQLKKYRTITKGPFPITVTKLEGEESFKMIGLEGEYQPIEPEKFGEDIVFIKVKPGKLRLRGSHVYNSVYFYIVIFGATLLWLGVFLNFKRTHRMKTDSAYARRLLAPRQAKKGLAKVKQLSATGNKEEYYDAIFKTIQRYLGNKLHLSSGAVTADTVTAELGSKNIEANVIDDVKVILEECDMFRYALADIDKETMDKSYQRLERNIDYLERHLK